MRAISPPQTLAERDVLVMSHVGLVKALARRLTLRLPAEVELNDLISAGLVGLIEAASRYRPSLGVPFDAFARRRVQGAMLDALRDVDWAPRSARRSARKLESALARLRHELAREPTEDEIAESLELSPEEYERLLEKVRSLETCSLRRLEYAGDDQSLLELRLEPEDGPDVRLERQELKRILARALTELPERERQILALYYEEEMTLAEIGAVFGVGESRISQLRSLAISRLRATLRAELSLPEGT